MNGLYPGPATAPGEKLAGGKPFGPGTNVRVGLKSGSPRKWTTAGPNLFASAEGESRVAVCTQAAHEIAILASLGAEFRPLFFASPASDASVRMNQTVWPLAVPLYRGRRTVS